MASSQEYFYGKDTSAGQKRDNFFSRWLDSQPMSESGILIITALIVGIGAGLGSVFFLWMLDTVQHLSFNIFADKINSFFSIFGSSSTGSTFPMHLVIIPAVGGLIVGPVIYFFAREAKGHGVPEVMKAVALRGGHMRPQVALIKVLASAITIGTGGSAGSEGPIAQIGAGLGSSVGQILKLSDERVRTLVACGAAGGIAAVFHAPIGGVLFAMEIILGRLHTIYFGAVVISAVTASVVSQMFGESSTLLSVPTFTLVSPIELVFYVILGLLTAVGAVIFLRVLDYSEGVFDNWHFPEYLKPFIGAVLLGILGLVTYKINGYPRIFGGGYNTINQAITGELEFKIIFALFFLKLIATVFTLGSGGSGGIFAPSLFMGAMMGGCFGFAVNHLFPGLTAPAGAYALVGMAALFSGAAHAPMTSILLVFEMSHDYRIILPLMLATVMSTLISKALSRESIYTIKLVRQGIHLAQGQDIDVMQGVSVGEIMTKNVITVTSDMSIEELSRKFNQSHYHSFPVVNNENILIGNVSVTDLDNIILDNRKEIKTVSEIATYKQLLVTYPYEPMWKALKLLGSRDMRRLPVVEDESSMKLVGMIYGSDIIRAYNRAIAKRAQMQYKAEMLRLGKIDQANFLNITIHPESPVIGKRITDLKLPDHCLIISIRRGRQLHIVDGHTVIHNGDQLTLLAEQSNSSCIRNLLEKSHEDVSVSIENNTKYREFTIPGEASCCGYPIQSLNLPHDCIIVSIERDGEIIVPHGNTLLLPGDVIQVFGVEDELDEIVDILKNNASPKTTD